jgi:hypothetical protein
MLAALAATPPARAEVDTPMVGGLPWRSGATGGGFPCLGQMRGRALDALNLLIAPNSFADMVKNTGGWLQSYASKAPLLVVSLALLPRNNRGEFAQCAAGAFDDYFRQIGANLQRSPAQGVVVRLGWEANIGSHSHPWGVDSPAQVPAYIQCWRHAATALKAGGPGLNLEWTNAKKTQNRALHVLDMYPGDDVVDVIGVHYYDSVSIGVQSGPRLGVQEGPTRGSVRGRRRRGRRREAVQGERSGVGLVSSPTPSRPRAAAGPQARALSRQLALPVSRISQWWVSRSRSAVVIFASPNTLGHSANGRLVVTTTEVRSYSRLTRWNSICPPARGNGR